jgi:phosphoribosylaminoimidazole-succinocarboxamide synthase
MIMTEPIRETDFAELRILKRGKVRDVYDLGEHLLLVATDRISAFDVVMPNPVPDKGIILTQISLFWFDVMQPLIENHVVTSDVKQYPEICQPYASVLQGRSMLVKKAQPLPVECIVRGYISGSGWKEYTESGSVCGIELPAGLKESQQLPEPIFTPSTKAEMGEHDINIDFNETVRLIGKTTAEKIRDLSMAIYKKGAALAAQKGIIIADTKFEFGSTGDDLLLIDEILTPDSSRFWPKETYRPGGPQKSYDKQYLRDYLNTLDWDKKAPGPPLPEDVIARTRQKYLDALTQLSGSSHGL